MKNAIPLTDCKHGFLYRTRCRNLLMGVFDSATSGFIGVREKFGYTYLFTEFHCDTGAPFGTVSPVSEICQCPIADLSEDSPELRVWLDEQETKYRSEVPNESH